MIESIQALEQHLAALRDGQAQLLTLSVEKRQVIIDGEPQKLDILVKQEREIIIELEKTEEQRAHIMAQLAKASGLPGTCTLVEFALLQDVKTQEALLGLRQEIIALVEEQARLNQINQKLLETQMQYMQFMTGVMLSQAQPSGVYGQNGMDAETSERFAFINHEI